MIYIKERQNNKNGMSDGTYYECVIDSASDLSGLPTDCAAGSMAYTADLEHVYIFSPSEQWTEVQW